MKIPYALNDPVQFWFWDVDEVIIFCAGIGVGILFSSGWLMLSSFVLTWWFGKFKGGQFRGSLLHIAFWFGIANLNKKFINGLIREMVD